MPMATKHKQDRFREPRVTISVMLLQSERDELARWAASAGVAMSTYMRWFVQNESEQRFLRRGG